MHIFWTFHLKCKHLERNWSKSTRHKCFKWNRHRVRAPTPTHYTYKLPRNSVSRNSKSQKSCRGLNLRAILWTCLYFYHLLNSKSGTKFERDKNYCFHKLIPEMSVISDNSHHVPKNMHGRIISFDIKWERNMKENCLHASTPSMKKYGKMLNL